MYRSDKVSAAEATKMITRSVAEAEKLSKIIAVSVCGPEGELIAFLRMDGVSAAASLIAQNKAYTSARDRKTTREMGEFMLTNNKSAAFWGDNGITGLGGGVPIVVNGTVIGGIGVSGLSEAEDERIANEAIKSVY